VSPVQSAVGMADNRLEPLVLSEEERRTLEEWIKIWNSNARPFKWTKTRWFPCGQGRVGCRRPTGITSGSAAAQAWASGNSASATSARPAAPIRFQGRAAA
jgi:hypothetical protein